MSSWDDQWPGTGAVARIDALPAEERQILAALAIVGRASLSSDELGALVETADVGPLLDDLERRGLLRREGEERYSVLGRVGADIRKLNQTLDTADRLIGYVETLAHGGRLTVARLEQDAEAILGIAAWGAEVRRWETLLEFVKTVQASFALAARFHQQRVLLELGRTAARALGDRAAEVWCLERLAQAADRVGDTAAQVEFTIAADSLRRAAGRPQWLRVALRSLAVVVVAGAGVTAGVVIPRHPAGSTTTVVTTRRVVVTRTVAGRTQTSTVTRTAFSTTTQLATTTFTTTVTTTAPSISTFIAKVRPTTT